MTFGRLVTAYLGWMGARPSQKNYRQIYLQFFNNSAWRDRPADAISRHDVLLLRQSLEATPTHANTTVKFLRQVYGWGMNRMDPIARRAFYSGSNPAAGIRGFKCHSRERLADREELSLLLNDLDNLSDTYQAFFGLRCLVPCRIKELCGLRRADVDANGKWAKGTTKNGRTHYVLIPRQGMALLNVLPSKGEYFFPGTHGFPIQEGSVRKVWQRWRAKLSASRPSLHDLQLLDMRRVYASYLYTEVKCDELFVKAALNHYDPRPVAIYTRLNYDRLAEIGQAYADWIWTLRVEGGHDGEMVPYRHAAGESHGLQHQSPGAEGCGGVFCGGL